MGTTEHHCFLSGPLSALSCLFLSSAFDTAGEFGIGFVYWRGAFGLALACRFSSLIASDDE